MQRFSTPRLMVQHLCPEFPVTCLRPESAATSARLFLEHFPGRVLYAVKTNPSPVILRAVCDAGVRAFDVASVAEIEAVARHCPGSRMCFMHPVKSREAIRSAYYDFGVRDFAVDCEEELDKILDVTGDPSDLGIFVRLTVPNRFACMQLVSKFGADMRRAPALLLNARRASRTLGVTFHVGSQTLAPVAYLEAMKVVDEAIRRAGVLIDVVDVGGGFPVTYPGMEAPPLESFLTTIADGFEQMLVSETTELWCEPGRAISAPAGVVVARVELRKEQTLYLNDGTYGGLFDAGGPGFIYPTRLLRREKRHAAEMLPFALFGPTCDSIDAMPGPFILPADVREGDYIEFGMLGAYSQTMRTAFNGFDAHETVLVDELDEPRQACFHVSDEAATV